MTTATRGQHEGSNFLRHTACPECGSSDANAEYDDGHTHCFACGRTASDGASEPAKREPTKTRGLVRGDWLELPSRGLTEETCRKFDYTQGTYKGRGCQVANYHDPVTRQVVAQKLRFKDKSFAVVGDGKHMPLYGQNLWPATGRRVVITEGEIDALSVAQATGHSWPTVSLPNGAQGAVAAIKRALEWLNGYESVVLCFDMDEAGQKAALECAPLFEPGKCAIASLTRKDANEMLKAGEVKALSSLLWNAKTYRPDGIVSLDEIEARVLANPEVGRPYPWPSLTKATFGRRPGDVIGLGAGSGVGKTDLFTQLIAHDVMELGIPCGVLYLEQSVGETGRRIAGKIAGRRFHVPDDGWTQDELEATWGKLKATGKLHLYDNFGVCDWDTIKSKMRYMVQSLGCRHLFLDHLTALAAMEDDERRALDAIMAEAASMAHALNFTLHYVSHLATPDGDPHEEGGRVQGKHFKGSRSILYWSHLLLGLERDTQDQTNSAVLRVLKDRYTGQANGTLIRLKYDEKTGLLSERSAAEAHGFKEDTDDF